VSVFDLNPHNAVADVDWMPVWAEAGTMAHATAIRIARAASVDYLLFADPTKTTTAENAETAKQDPVSAHSAGTAVRRGQTWRVGEIETDARMLFCRVVGDRPVSRLAMVDGSLVRTPGRRGFQLALPSAVPDLHLDFTADARVAGPSFGARLVVGGRELPIELDRRAAPR
jgi:hypothetical protein